jgi:hypothetical protein
MATKAEILAAAKNRFKSETVELGKGVSVTLRELTPTQRDDLNKRLYKHTDDGKPEVVKNDAGKECWVPVAGSNYSEEWLAATMHPAFTVEELLADDWPTSLKDMLCDKARALNGITLADAAKNS